MPGDLTGVLVKLAELLERLGVEYAVGGAIAQNYWGTVRATVDIDVLISLPRVRFEALATALSEEGFTLLDASGARAPVTATAMAAEEHDRRLFTVYHNLVKVEIFLPFLPLQHSILRRAVKLPLGSRRIPITTAEDLILLKMAFHREKDLRDVRGILWSQKGRLDIAYLRDESQRILCDEAERRLEEWIAEYGST